MFHYTNSCLAIVLAVVIALSGLIGTNETPGIMISSHAQNSRSLKDLASHEVISFKANTVTVSSVAFSPDNWTIASAYKEVRLWDLKGTTVKQKHALDKEEALVMGLRFSPDGRWLVSRGAIARQVRLWDLTESPPKEMVMPRGHTSSIDSMAFSPDGKILATSGTKDLTVRLWDLSRGQPKEKAVLRGHIDSVCLVAFSPDGKVVASAGGDDTIRLWDPAREKPRELKTIQLKSKRVDLLEFTPDGRIVLEGAITPAEGKTFGGSNVTVTRWDIATGQTVNTMVFKGSDSKVLSLALSPDGKTLVTSYDNGEVVLWETASAKKVRQWKLPARGRDVAFASDGKRIATANEDGTVSIIVLIP